MRTIEVNLFQFDELDAKAKEKAREWYRNARADDNFWEFTYEDFQSIVSLMGIELAQSHHTKSPDIQFTGFWSQGDGASFTGKYTFSEGAEAKVKDYAPEDERLHELAAMLDRIQAAHGNCIAAKIERMNSHYAHENTMTADAWLLDENGEDTGEVDSILPEQAFKELLQVFRALATWLYRSLEKEYEYQNSDESVDETIRDNAYEFTADGKIH